MFEQDCYLNDQTALFHEERVASVSPILCTDVLHQSAEGTVVEALHTKSAALNMKSVLATALVHEERVASVFASMLCRK